MATRGYHSGYSGYLFDGRRTGESCLRMLGVWKCWANSITLPLAVFVMKFSCGSRRETNVPNQPPNVRCIDQENKTFIREINGFLPLNQLYSFTWKYKLKTKQKKKKKNTEINETFSLHKFCYVDVFYIFSRA